MENDQVVAASGSKLLRVALLFPLLALACLSRMASADDGNPPPTTLPTINVPATEHPCSYYGMVAVDDGAACESWGDLFPGNSGMGGGGFGGAGAGKPFTPANTAQSNKK